MSRREDIHTCYTIVKLKCTRIALRFLLRLHLWWEVRQLRKSDLDYDRTMYDLGENDPECQCGSIFRRRAHCKCGCGCCTVEEEDEKL